MNRCNHLTRTESVLLQQAEAAEKAERVSRKSQTDGSFSTFKTYEKYGEKHTTSINTGEYGWWK